MQRPWGVLLSGLFSIACSAHLLIEPRDGNTHTGLGPSPSILIKKMPYSWILRKYFLPQLKVPSDDSSLCQADIKLASAAADSEPHVPRDLSAVGDKELLGIQGHNQISVGTWVVRVLRLQYSKGDVAFAFCFHEALLIYMYYKKVQLKFKD